jgi:hypothetical protein
MTLHVKLISLLFKLVVGQYSLESITVACLSIDAKYLSLQQLLVGKQVKKYYLIIHLLLLGDK